MTTEEARAIAQDKSALKEQLREALCYMCRVPYDGPGTQPSEGLLSFCQYRFMHIVEKRTGIRYTFERYEWKFLRSIIAKLKALKPDMDDKQTEASFEALIQKMPQWYWEHNYRLNTINKNFDIIVNAIRKGNGKPVSDDYKQRIAEELLR